MDNLSLEPTLMIYAEQELTIVFNFERVISGALFPDDDIIVQYRDLGHQKLE